MWLFPISKYSKIAKQSSFFCGIEFSQQVDVIRQLLQIRFPKFKSYSVAFFKILGIDCVSFAEFAYTVFVVMTMLALSMLTCKDILDMGGCTFQESTMLINMIQVEPKNNAAVSDIYPGSNLFVFDSGFRVDDHILAPAITTADAASEVVTKLGNLPVKSQDEFPVLL
jgi:hypothetical protein